MLYIQARLRTLNTEEIINLCKQSTRHGRIYHLNELLPSCTSSYKPHMSLSLQNVQVTIQQIGNTAIFAVMSKN